MTRASIPAWWYCEASSVATVSLPAAGKPRRWITADTRRSSRRRFGGCTGFQQRKHVPRSAGSESSGEVSNACVGLGWRNPDGSDGQQLAVGRDERQEMTRESPDLTVAADHRD